MSIADPQWRAVHLYHVHAHVYDTGLRTHMHTHAESTGYCPRTRGSRYSTVMKGAGSPVLHTVIQPEMVNHVNDFLIRGYEKIESNKYI